MRKGRPKILSTHLVVDRYVNLELFNKKQNKLANGCWEWTGITNNAGYGFIGFIYADKTDRTRGRGMMTTHRLAWIIKHNRLPTKRNINHTCNNKLCLNPDHLSEGTQQDKLNQMVAAGIKGGRKFGVRVGPYNHEQTRRKYKYTHEEIQWIRTATTKDIAEKYNTTILRAAGKRHAFRNGYRWLPLPEGVKK